MNIGPLLGCIDGDVSVVPLSARSAVGAGQTSAAWQLSLHVSGSIDPSSLEIANSEQRKTHAKPFPRSLWIE